MCTPKAGGQATSNTLSSLTGAAGHPSHRPQPAHTGLVRQRQSAVGLHLRNPSLMDYYSFNRPPRDGRLSQPCWLTDSGRFTHKVVTRPAVSLGHGYGKHAGRTGGLTTMLRLAVFACVCRYQLSNIIEPNKISLAHL